MAKLLSLVIVAAGFVGFFSLSAADQPTLGFLAAIWGIILAAVLWSFGK